MTAVVASGGGSLSAGGGGGNGNPPFAPSCTGFIHGCRCHRCAFRRVREKEIETRKTFHRKVCRNIFGTRHGKRIPGAEGLLSFEEFNEVLDKQTRLMQEVIAKMRRRAQRAVGGPAAAVKPKGGADPEMRLNLTLVVAASMLADIGSGDPTKDPPIEE